MRNLFLIPVVALGAMSLSLSSCAKKSVSIKTDVDSMSYAIGVNTGANFKQSLENIPGGEANVEAMIAGFTEAIKGEKTKITPEQAMTIMQTYFQNAEVKDAKKAKEEGEKFIKENKTKSGVQVTASGLQYKVEKEGEGLLPSDTSNVTVNYKGTLVNGTVFDSSYDRKEPAVMNVSGVIPGFKEGLKMMPVGAKYTFYIPSNLAYGDRPAGGKIKANSVLIFEVEMLSIDGKPEIKKPEPKADPKAEVKPEKK